MITIKMAALSDMPLIMEMVLQLAEYEKLRDEVVATPELLQAAIFGPHARVFCDIARDDGKPAGFALWYYSFSTFQGRHGIYLEDILVQEPYRGRGIGKAMLSHLAKRCLAENLGRLEWSVLDWNIPSIDFYKSQGAVMMGDWVRARITDDALARLAGGAK